MCEEKNKLNWQFSLRPLVLLIPYFQVYINQIQATHTTCQNIFGECKMLKQQHNHPIQISASMIADLLTRSESFNCVM